MLWILPFTISPETQQPEVSGCWSLLLGNIYLSVLQAPPQPSQSLPNDAVSPGHALIIQSSRSEPLTTLALGAMGQGKGDFFFFPSCFWHFFGWFFETVPGSPGWPCSMSSKAGLWSHQRKTEITDKLEPGLPKF